MTRAVPVPVQAIHQSPALARRFKAVIFDWDGTAVPDGRVDATRIRRLVEQACAQRVGAGGRERHPCRQRRRSAGGPPRRRSPAA